MALKCDNSGYEEQREIIQLGPKPKQNLHDFYRAPFSSVAIERNPSPRWFRNVHMLAQKAINVSSMATGHQQRANVGSSGVDA
ncbi:hypothetical protein ACEPPN_018103 [Leptodophora sp. 'Broadleaf-Isolate-01']